MTAHADPRLPVLPWARFKRAAFLTMAGVVVVISMFGWLGSLALAVLDLCAMLSVS